MKNDEKKYTLYLCDPQKNTECPKGNCQIPDGCFLTIKKEFAVTDENGKPTTYKVKMPNSCCHAGNTGRKETKMKSGIEILKEVYFCSDEKTAKICGMEFSEKYSYMQVLIDWDKREIRTYIRSLWNRSYDVSKTVKF